MYTPPAFRVEELTAIHEAMRAARTATLVTSTAEGMIGTPLPLFLDRAEGSMGTLYGHVAKANPQWKLECTGEAMAIFNGPEAYVSPSWYETKQQTHKVVPTWNYLAVHAYGKVEFFDDPDRLLDVVTRLTSLHEKDRPDPWAVSDAPPEYIASQLKGIVGLRMPITRLDGKSKMSQNKNAADRAGVKAGLTASQLPQDRAVADLIPND